MLQLSLSTLCRIKGRGILSGLPLCVLKKQNTSESLHKDGLDLLELAEFLVHPKPIHSNSSISKLDVNVDSLLTVLLSIFLQLSLHLLQVIYSAPSKCDHVLYGRKYSTTIFSGYHRYLSRRQQHHATSTYKQVTRLNN